MKFKFSLKDKEVSLDADVEKLVEKKMDQNEKLYIASPKEGKVPKLERKTKYQIKQEEKRKNQELQWKLEQERRELEIKQAMRIAKFCSIAFAVIITLCIVMSFFE